MDRTLNVQGTIVGAINDLRARVDNLEAQQQVTIIVRNQTGNPASGATGQIIINTVDNNAKIWGEGNWREIASW